MNCFILKDTRLFERNNALKFELAEIKIANQRLFQENIEYQKSPGGSGGSSSSQGASNSYSIDKLRQLDEQLLNAKDQVIDLQKKLVEVSHIDSVNSNLLNFLLKL